MPAKYRVRFLKPCTPQVCKCAHPCAQNMHTQPDVGTLQPKMVTNQHKTSYLISTRLRCGLFRRQAGGLKAAPPWAWELSARISISPDYELSQQVCFHPFPMPMRSSFAPQCFPYITTHYYIPLSPFSFLLSPPLALTANINATS